MMITNVVCGKTKGWTFLFNGKESSITDSRWDAEINEKMIDLESKENELSELIKHKTEEKKNLEAQIKSINAQIKKEDKDDEKQLLKDKLSDFQIELDKIDTLLKNENANLSDVKSSIKSMIENVPKNKIEALWKFFKKGGKAESYVQTDEDILLSKKNEISQHIYTHYSERKQNQDRGYQTYSQTVIVGVTSQNDNPVTLDALTVEVMGVVLRILAETLTLEAYVQSKPQELQEHYEKLVKIGLRLKWTKKCIDEGKLAIVEGREPNYPNFPTFN